MVVLPVAATGGPCAGNSAAVPAVVRLVVVSKLSTDCWWLGSGGCGSSVVIALELELGRLRNGRISMNDT